MMGCTSSISYTRTSCTFSKHPGHVTARRTRPVKRTVELSLADRNAVQKTWPTLASDMQSNGLQVFLRIFEQCPEAKALFSVENVRHSELARNVIIKAHGTRFVRAIAAVIENLEEFDQKENRLGRLLFVLGQQHKQYKGFRPEYFEVFYESLMWQWERCLGATFTAEVSNSWSQVFVYLLACLKDGYFSHDDGFEIKI